MADERSYEYTPPEFSVTVEATASASCGGSTGPSSTLGAYTTIPDVAWQYQWNTPPTPITEVTYNVEGVPDHGITSYMQLGCVSSINQARPSTSRAGMEEASANFEGGATISESTMVHQGNTQHQLAERTSTVFGHTGMTETKSTGLALPVDSSSSGDYAVASTSRIGTEKASDSSGNDARNATATGGTEEQEYRGVRACDQSSVKKLNLECEACGKFIRGAHSLPGHYRTHTGQKPYKCEVCQKSFADKSNCRRHQ